jgi:hypothetical protein
MDTKAIKVIESMPERKGMRVGSWRVIQTPSGGPDRRFEELSHCSVTISDGKRFTIMVNVGSVYLERME